METSEIAVICHQANKALCELLGDDSQKNWGEAEQWQKDSAIKGVEFTIAHPELGPSAQHEAWLKDKFSDGWKYGPVKDPEKKEHPCMVPYLLLPPEQRAKDHLFRAIVLGLSSIELE